MPHFHKWERGEISGFVYRACSRCEKIEQHIGGNGGSESESWGPIDDRDRQRISRDTQQETPPR
jgi:hypothetical protein